MACNYRTNTIVYEPSEMYFGKEGRVCVEPVTGMAGGESFNISNTDTDYYLWFTVDAVGVDPAPAGKTGIQVDLPAAYTVANAISLIKTAVETAKAFYGYLAVDGSAITLENYRTGASNGAVADVDTGFTLTESQIGSRVSLGKTSEGVTVTFEKEIQTVTANETGSTVLDQQLSGETASIEASLLEVSPAKLKELIGKGYGDTFTPDGGTEVIGAGTTKIGLSSFALAGKLELHPIRLEETDRSEDFTFWKTVPEASSINYSSTEQKAVSITFNAIIDETKPEEVSLYVIAGDSQQYFI
jgi:hypothetical protein